MPRLHVRDLELDDFDAPQFAPIRRSQAPVSSRNSHQRRAEDIGNRLRREARRFKEQTR